MGADNFTGIITFNFIKRDKHFNKYTIIQSQCPKNYKSLDHFKAHYDLNNLKWCKTLEKAQQIAESKEELFTTHHGIVYIDYTNNFDPIEIKLIYSNEFKQLYKTNTIINGIFNYLLYITYLIFMLKLIHNLYY